MKGSVIVLDDKVKLLELQLMELFLLLMSVRVVPGLLNSIQLMAPLILIHYHFDSLNLSC